MTSPTFAEAQQRLLARRAAREAARETDLARSPASHPSTPSSRLWNSVANTLSRPARPGFRVGHLDASLLDEELVDLLRTHVSDALRYFAGGALAQDWAAEIQLALRAVLFKLTIWDHDASYGAALQNLRYSDARHRPSSVLVPPSRWQKGAYGAVTVLGRYVWDRWEGWLRDRDEGFTVAGAEDGAEGERGRQRVRVLARMTDMARTAHAAAAVVSFLAFLLRGRYRTLLDRVLRMRLVPPTSRVSREVSFEYQNRQLVWHAFTEFLLFVLPLLGISRWRRWVTRFWRRTKAGLRQQRQPADADADDAPAGEYAFLPERTCAVCYHEQNAATASAESEMTAVAAAAGGVVGSAATDVTSPYEAVPCGCVYCFVCIANCLEAEEGEGWTCIRCGVLVRECRPWAGDVLEKKVRSWSKHSVTFDASVVGGEEEDDDEIGDESLQFIEAEPLEDGVF